MDDGGWVWQEQRVRDGLPPLPDASPLLDDLPEEVPIFASLR